MSGLFSRVLKQVFMTFDRENVSTFKNNFALLKQLVDQLTANDLCINHELFTEESFQVEAKAPCTYVHIFQNNTVAMSVFILKGNYTMPLHDHSMMHGILKGLSGKLLVKSYSKIRTMDDDVSTISNCNDDSLRNDLLSVIASDPKTVTSSSECAILTPTENNFHEITAIDGVAAFFDILSPPYEADIPIYGRRRCNFYKKIHGKRNNEYFLQKIPAPLSYYCDTGDYETPNVLNEYLKEETVDSF